MKYYYLITLACFALLTACGGDTADYRTSRNGVTVSIAPHHPNGVSRVRLSVITDHLIRVSATPDAAFADPQSLVVLPQSERVPFEVTQQNDTVRLSTNALHAFVRTTTGEVWFTDLSGNLLLAEEEGGGKTFTPIEVEGDKGYTIRQVFRSPVDEAFYGLGQHQSDEFNYKGRNEELFQYNTKVSVPFIVSSRNYGILLDSYALSRFGNPAPYSQLGDLFTLYDKEGTEGALTGTYRSADGSDPLVRREDSLYFETVESIKNLPAGFPLNGAEVTYEGELEARETGEYRFILYYAGYTKVYVDGKLLVPERWRTAWNPNSYKFAVTMQAGERKAIRVEWKPDGGTSYCGLRALAPVAPEEQGKQSWWTEMARQLDYYFIGGDNMDDVISGYRTLTGKAPIMPRWAMGYWQSRERYKTSEELTDVLREFRRRRIPIDNIVLDWFYWRENDWGSHDFDPARFPNPKAMVDTVHALNAHLMISVWPKFYTTTEHYRQFAERGEMYLRSVQDSLRDWVGPGYHYGFYDAYSADARKLFWQQMYEKLYPLGIDAWWMDASEPNIMDCTDMPYRKALQGPTALGSSTEYFNAYALMNAEAIYNGQRSIEPDKRVFLLTRSGFAGLQRYSTATWSGDIGTRWEDLKAQISAGLNFSMSGIPYWTMDIGGFCVENRYVSGQQEWERTGVETADYREWRELNTRWYQFGAFVSLFRSHGQFPFRELWNIAPEGHPAYESIAYYTRLRYRLLPYIYSLAGQTYLTDYTLMRPLVMDFPTDNEVHPVGDQYMFGSALMAAPVYRYGDRSREVYFPKGAGWYDFYSGTYLTGGEHRTVAAPYERMPLYVRAGSILPVGEELQYTGEKPQETIRLYVYRGADATFTLYEDEGVNYNYEQGKYALIPITYDEQQQTLTIGTRAGDFPGMLRERTFVIVFVDKDHPQPFDPQAQGKTVHYNGQEIIIPNR
jgi:alpha-D-xyloside xylohydrolase